MAFSDFGIILEMIGFFLFLVSATNSPDLVNYRMATGKPPSKWRYLYCKIPGEHSSQGGRVLGIALILLGLILQLSYFNPF